MGNLGGRMSPNAEINSYIYAVPSDLSSGSSVGREYCCWF